MSEELRKQLEIDATGAKKSVDDVNKSLKETDKLTDEVGSKSKTSWAMFTAGVAGAIFVLKQAWGQMSKFVQASNEAETATAKLTFLLGDQASKYIKLSEELQKVTRYEDDQIKSGMALALSMGAQEKNLEKITKGAIGLSAALNIDLDAAMKMSTQAIESGSYTLLSRYLPALTTAKTEAEKIAIVQGVMSKGFDLAKDSVKTTAGQMEQLKNETGDLSESIGLLIKNFLEPFIPIMRSVIGVLNEWIGTASGAADAAEALIAAQERQAKAAEEADKKIKPLTDKIAKLKEEQIKLMASYEALKKAEEEEAKAKEERIKEEERLISELLNHNKAMREYNELVSEAKLRGDEFIESGIKEMQTEITKTADDIDYLGDHLKVSLFDKLDLYMSKYSDIFKSYLDVGSQYNAMETAQVDAKYKEQAQKYKDMLDTNQINKEQYETYILKLENKAEKEKRKILKRQQKIDYAMTVVNTSAGVMSAFKAPDNVTMFQKWAQAIAVAAKGALELGTIAAQKFATGGWIKGAGTTTSDSIPIMASNKEFMVNARTATQELPNITQAVDTFQRTGSKAGLIQAAQRDAGGSSAGMTIIQPKATAAMKLNRRDLAFWVLEEINTIKREGHDTDRV